MEWLSLKQLVDLLGMSHRQIQRILAAGSYKKIPLQVREVKSQKGKPTYLIYWNTGTGLPVPNNPLIEVVKAPPTSPQAVAVQTGGSFLGGIGEVAPVYLQSEVITAEVFGGDYKGKIITPAKGEEERVTPHFEDEQGVLTLEQEFENLLAYKIQGKSGSAKKVMRARYRKQFQETGEIPLILQGTGKDGRKNSGRRTELPPEIVEAFVSLVIGSADRENKKTFVTQPLRKIRSFQTALEWQFKTEISYKSLTNLAIKYDVNYQPLNRYRGSSGGFD